MKKIFLAAAIIGMTGFAFGQQQTSTKDTKDSKSCHGTCCKKGSCTKGSKKASASTSSSTSSATAACKASNTK